MKVKDLLFTFDFKSLIKPHLYSEFKGHGSSGQIHVFRFRRVDGSLHPHISYKFWHQSSTWLPADGFSLRILSSRPDLRDPKQIQVSPYLSVVPATEIVFKKYQLLGTFPFAFPHTGELPAVSGWSCSAQLLCLPSGVSAERQNALLSVRGIVSAEQPGPLDEPIPYPGYSAKERDRKIKARVGLLAWLAADEGGDEVAVVVVPAQQRGTLRLPTLWLSCWLRHLMQSWTCFISLRLCASDICAIPEPRSASTR